MIDIVKDRCVGCSACKSKCPKNCIDLKSNAEGFLYPQIDYKLCVKCGLCEQVCPVLCKKDVNNYEIKTYAVKSKDEQVRLNSSSGGAFYLFAKYVLENGGVVFGAAFDEKFKVRHDFIENLSELGKLQGSKYVQSDIGDNYVKAEKFLQEGRLVLFSGTPCQVAGLKTYLGKDYENLLALGLICHGVPSPRAWEKYLAEITKEHNSTPQNVSFRHKSKNSDGYGFRVEFTDDKIFYEKQSKNKYLQVFLKNYCLRLSCYNCNFKNYDALSDIIIGDFWGIENYLPNFYDEKGISILIVNSHRGASILKTVKQDKTFCFDIADRKWGEQGNPMLLFSTPRPIERDIFLTQVKNKSFVDALKITETKVARATKIKIFKEDIDAVKQEKGNIYALLYRLKHFWKVYF